MIEAPTEQVVVARRHKETRSGKPLRCADQGLEILVCLPNRVGKKVDSCRIARNPTKMLDHPGLFLADRIGKLLTAIKPMHRPVEGIAGVEIRARCRPNLVAG